MATPSGDASAPLLPDYSGAWVGGIVPGLLGGAAPSWFPSAVRGARAVVLLVLDGLGWETLAGAARLMPQLSALEGRSITTVVPSTTAAALTSITTGVPPSVHGVAGYRIRVGGRALNVLRWQSRGDDAVPSPPDVQPVPPFLGRRVPVVTKAEFRKTGFTEAHLRGGELTGWKTVSALLELVAGHVASGAGFVYAYYDGVDKVAHEYGLRSAVHATELVLTDRLVGDLLDRLPPDVALIVTADHGQVDVPDPDAAAVPLDDVGRMVSAYSGEGRFRGLHARSGANGALLEACRAAYGDRAWVRSREQVFDEAWLGPGATLAARGRIGDVLLAARAPVVFADPGLPKEMRMRSQHGSLTSAEVLVPLLAGRGRGGGGP